MGCNEMRNNVHISILNLALRHFDLLQPKTAKQSQHQQKAGLDRAEAISFPKQLRSWHLLLLFHEVYGGIFLSY